MRWSLQCSFWGLGQWFEGSIGVGRSLVEGLRRPCEFSWWLDDESGLIVVRLTAIIRRLEGPWLRGFGWRRALLLTG